MNNDTAATLAVMVLAALGIAVLAYVLMPTAAGALECQERPGDHRSYWSYRIVDGERCWYRGHRVIPKSRLHWPAEPKPKPIKGDPVFKIRAEVKTVPADEVNAIDAMAQEPPTPFVYLSDKLQGWAMFWANRIGEVFNETKP